MKSQSALFCNVVFLNGLFSQNVLDIFESFTCTVLIWKTGIFVGVHLLHINAMFSDYDTFWILSLMSYILFCFFFRAVLDTYPGNKLTCF